MTNPKITKDDVLAVITDKPQSAAEIAKKLDVYRGTPIKYLDALQAQGKVRREDLGWVLGAAPVTAVEATQPSSDDMSIADTIYDVVLHAKKSDYYVTAIEREAESHIDNIADSIANHSRLIGTYVAILAYETYADDEHIDDIDYDDIQDLINKIEMHHKALTYLKALARGMRDRA